MRRDKRVNDELRKITIKKSYTKYAEGSVLIQAGNTKVICNATVDERVPPFLKGANQGWVTAEYSMLPRSTHTRSPREAQRGRIGGRTHEIQRLIGRALRSVVDLNALGERTIIIDCDVIQADGGTRTLSITGAYIALYLALKRLLDKKLIDELPITDSLAAVSVGIIDGEVMLDLNYNEDSRACVDMNVIMTGGGRFVEVQGTAEKTPFTQKQLTEMLKCAKTGIEQLLSKQNEALGV